MIQILGLAKRLMRYYRKVGVPNVTGKRSTDIKPSKALEIPKNMERPQANKA